MPSGTFTLPAAVARRHRRIGKNATSTVAICPFFLPPRQEKQIPCNSLRGGKTVLEDILFLAQLAVPTVANPSICLRGGKAVLEVVLLRAIGCSHNHQPVSFFCEAAQDRARIYSTSCPSLLFTQSPTHPSACEAAWPCSKLRAQVWMNLAATNPFIAGSCFAQHSWLFSQPPTRPSICEAATPCSKLFCSAKLVCHATCPFEVARSVSFFPPVSLVSTPFF